MKIIKIQGGLGNQLFQFFLSFSFIKNEKIYFDISHFNKYKDRNFKLDLIIKDLDYINLSFLQNRYLKRILNLFFPKRYFIQSNPFENTNFNHTGFAYLDGYWQNLNYLNKYKSEILSKISLKDFDTESVIKYKKSVTNSDVIVHVRRGDYVGNKIHFTCDFNYYNNAIKLMNDMFEVTNIYFISDDIIYCKETFKEINNAVFIENTEDEIEDFILINSFNNIIISNSTFSWCAAWLTNVEKTIIAPKKWINQEVNVNLYPKEWLLI